MCCATAASIRSVTRGSHSAWESTGWRCCAMASTICGCSSRTICASCASSLESPAAHTHKASQGMKFPESWLRSIVDPALSSEELAHLLTMAGLEVEEREPVAPGFDRVVVGAVAKVEPHPQADRLRICSVDVGGEMLRIVCGAPNVHVGMKVACALVGARLPKATITRATVRGIESAGMLCSAA